jgi:hypothetical protein
MESTCGGRTGAFPGLRKPARALTLIPCAWNGAPLQRSSSTRIFGKSSANRHSYSTYHYYRCTTHNKMAPGKCTGQTIRMDKLEKAVLVFLQTMVNVSVEFDALLEKIRHSAARKTESAALQKTLEQQKAEREKYRRMSLELYPDWKSGILSREEYLSLREDLTGKIQSLDTTIEKLRQTAEQYAGNMEQENEFLAHFRKYRNFAELTRPMLTELVHEIRIFEGGRLEIILNFQDELKALTEYLELNQDTLEEEVCAN